MAEKAKEAGGTVEAGGSSCRLPIVDDLCALGRAGNLSRLAAGSADDLRGLSALFLAMIMPL